MSDNPTLNFTVPQPQVPFVTEDGKISREWLYYMVGIWRRTGGSHGIPVDLLQAQISALFAEVAMADVETPWNPTSFILFGQAMNDDMPSPGLNPIMAALAVGDMA